MTLYNQRTNLLYTIYMFLENREMVMLSRNIFYKYIFTFLVFFFFFTFIHLLFKKKRSFFNNTWGFACLVGCTVLKIFGYLKPKCPTGKLNSQKGPSENSDYFVRIKKGEWKKIIGISDEFALTALCMLRASLVAQTVKNLHATWETQVQSPSWEDPLEKGTQPTPVFLPGESYWWRSLKSSSPWGCKELDTTEQLTQYPKFYTSGGRGESFSKFMEELEVCRVC